MLTFYYSNSYIPSAPIIQVILQHPDGSPTVGPIPAFVDSGADATIVPQHYVDQLGTKSGDEGYVRSAWGTRKRITFHMMDIRIGDYLAVSIDVLADKNVHEVILGRDVLNQFRVTLDGPGEVVEVES